MLPPIFTAMSSGAQIGDAFGGLFPDSRRTSGNSRTTSTGTSTTNSSTSSSTSYGSSTSYDIRNMTPEALEALSRALALSEKISSEFYNRYSPEKAKERAEQAVQQIFREYRETQLPQIFTQQSGAGLYNSTTGQLLANDAFARATDLANARAFEIEKGYADLQLSGVGMFLRSLDVAKGAVKQGSESTSGGSSTVSSTTSVTNSQQESNTVSQSNSRERSGRGIGRALGAIGGLLNFLT